MVLQAGGSEPGQALAARTADVVFSVVQDIGEAKAGYAALKKRLPDSDRSPDHVTVLPGVMPVVGRTDKEALREAPPAAELRERPECAAASVRPARTGHDVYELDGPIPDISMPDTYHSFARVMLAKARRENMTLRDLYNLVAAARGHWVLCGSAESIADTLQQWFEERAADGFNVMPPYFTDGFDDFVDLVVPILQERGLFRRDYTGSTLRDHFGLPRPANPHF